MNTHNIELEHIGSYIKIKVDGVLIASVPNEEAIAKALAKNNLGGVTCL